MQYNEIMEIIELFKKSPQDGYQKLIYSDCYFNKKFWKIFKKNLDIDRFQKEFPDSIKTLNNMIYLNLFHDLYQHNKKNKEKYIAELKKFNLDKVLFIEYLFIILDIGQNSDLSRDLPKYSNQNLQTIKTILKEISPKLNNNSGFEYSLEVAQTLLNLVNTYIEIDLIKEFVDIFIWADFSIKVDYDKKECIMSIAEEDKGENLFILNNLKTKVKNEYNRKNVSYKISEETHFKKIDPKLKTNEGLAIVFIIEGNAEVTFDREGLTFLKLDDFKDDFKDNENGEIKVLKLMMKQNFHLRFREALSNIYEPKDEIDIHLLYIELTKKISVSLYELLCAMSCLIAEADNIRYYFEFPNTGSIKSIKELLKNNENLNKTDIDSMLLGNLDFIEKGYKKNKYFFTKASLKNLLRKIEELKIKSDEELDAIINLFSNINSPLAFSPIYKIDDI
ncbi:hypothetical protein JXR93_02095, partial [bacterium]|nr:hypothetical protein [bacterium]